MIIATTLIAALVVLFVCGLVWFRISEESPCDHHHDHHDRRNG